MSDLSPAAQELDEDLRVLMHDTVGAPNTVRERVWGSATGVPRKVEESRALYRVPIVDAFAASGAETLAEFPERVKAFAHAYFHPDHTECQAQRLQMCQAHTALETEHELVRADRNALRARSATLLHERDQAQAAADRYHDELIDVGQNELHMLRKERDALRRERDEAQANIRAMAEQVLSLSARVNEVKAERDQARTSADCLRVMLAGAPGGQLLTEVEQARADLAKQVAALTAENAGLRRSVRRLCRILGKAMAGDL